MRVILIHILPICSPLHSAVIYTTCLLQSSSLDTHSHTFLRHIALHLFSNFYKFLHSRRHVYSYHTHEKPSRTLQRLRCFSKCLLQMKLYIFALNIHEVFIMFMNKMALFQNIFTTRILRPRITFGTIGKTQ